MPRKRVIKAKKRGVSVTVHVNSHNKRKGGKAAPKPQQSPMIFVNPSANPGFHDNSVVHQLSMLLHRQMTQEPPKLEEMTTNLSKPEPQAKAPLQRPIKGLRMAKPILEPTPMTTRGELILTEGQKPEIMSSRDDTPSEAEEAVKHLTHSDGGTHVKNLVSKFEGGSRIVTPEVQKQYQKAYKSIPEQHYITAKQGIKFLKSKGIEPISVAQPTIKKQIKNAGLMDEYFEFCRLNVLTR